MSEVTFIDPEAKALEAQAFHGERARGVRDGKDWRWLEEFIFGAIQDQAIATLINAKTEEQRIAAQQMFLAIQKPRQQLEFLINQGDAARTSLIELSTRGTAEEGESNV